MSSKRKKASSSGPQRVYTTRQVMEMTQQRRLKEEAAEREPELKAAQPLEIKLPLVTESRDPIPAKAIAGFLALILSLITLFFIVSSKPSEFWMIALVAKINALIVYGSFFILRFIQGACTAEGVILNTPYYKISLQGDLVALYSLELLVIFAALFVYFKKTTWIKRGEVFISLALLAVFANIFRVVVAFGLALNYGALYADRYFNGVLAGLVFVLIVIGLILLEFLFFPEN